METGKKTAIFIGGLLLAGILAATCLPGEPQRNTDALIRIGSGNDISGLLMEEVVADLEGTYKVSESLESSSFQDC